MSGEIFIERDGDHHYIIDDKLFKEQPVRLKKVVDHKTYQNYENEARWR